ncbi:MAG TPA: ADP-ribosylglycohydrolase family protein [Nitrosospira sp.]|nr:ADP-ribosylglycohydrolase family protein [Nitrosospira sp.]
MPIPSRVRYHSDLKAGQFSQTGIILRFMLRSLIERGSYDEADFCRSMDEEIFPLLNGMPVNGPGYTQPSIRDTWRKRVQQNQPWGQMGGEADTTEAIGRTLALAVRYAFQPEELAATISSNTRLTQIDDIAVTLTVAYGAVLSLLVQAQAQQEPFGQAHAIIKGGKTAFPHDNTYRPAAAPDGLSAEKRALRLSECPPHALICRDGRDGPGYTDRACMESLRRL